MSFDQNLEKEGTDAFNNWFRQVGQGLQPPSAAKVVDASGKLVLPGGIDAHTHLQLSLNGVNTVDDFLIGSKAALAGGTTTVREIFVLWLSRRSVSQFQLL